MQAMLAVIAAVVLTQASLPKSLTGHVGVVVGDKLYTTGGMDDRTDHRFIGTLWEFDLKSEKWTARAPMATPRAMAACARIGGSIYVAGGFSQSGEYLNSVERYDIVTRRWTTVAPMRTARTRFALLNFKGRLLAIGGLAGRSDSDSLNIDGVEEYDARSNRWKPAGKLQTGRHGFAAVLKGDRIIVIGGYVGSDAQVTSTCELFDPDLETSHPIASLPSARGFPGAVILGGSIVCLGGRPPGDHPCRYDDVGKRWIDVPEPDIQASRFVAFVREGKVLVAGGEFRNNAPLLQSLAFGPWR